MTAAGSPAADAAPHLWIVDLDGVVWLSGEPIGDVAGAVTRLRSQGARVVFATNNSATTLDALVERLRRIGIDAPVGDLVSSAGAVASLLEPGQSVRVLAEVGVFEALEQRGVVTDRPEAVDAAVVGWTRSFDFDAVAAAADAARSSGRLLGTNEDPTHPTPQGLVPGSGALIAAVATASGVAPEFAGKPHEPMARLMRQRFGFETGAPGVVMVGDQPGTDGRLAERLGIPFALVDSGVTPPGASGFGAAVSIRAPDLVSLVASDWARGAA
jgi:HAD superfamily hydrolase (TIGR01450 family)